ncbi:hypothetical protein ACFLT9_08700 [Acidobacteriota bacterium]
MIISKPLSGFVKTFGIDLSISVVGDSLFQSVVEELECGPAPPRRSEAD